MFSYTTDVPTVDDFLQLLLQDQRDEKTAVCRLYPVLSQGGLQFYEAATLRKYFVVWPVWTPQYTSPQIVEGWGVRICAGVMAFSDDIEDETIPWGLARTRLAP